MSDRENRQELKEILAGCDAFLAGEKVVPPLINEYALVANTFAEENEQAQKVGFLDAFLKSYLPRVEVDTNYLELAPLLAEDFLESKKTAADFYRKSELPLRAAKVITYTLIDLADSAGSRLYNLELMKGSQNMVDENINNEIVKINTIRKAALEARDLP